MKPIYEENEETLEIAEQISCHIPHIFTNQWNLYP